MYTVFHILLLLYIAKLALKWAKNDEIYEQIERILREKGVK